MQARCRYRNERKIQPEKNTKQHEQHFSIPSPRPKHYNRRNLLPFDSDEETQRITDNDFLILIFAVAWSACKLQAIDFNLVIITARFAQTQSSNDQKIAGGSQYSQLSADYPALTTRIRPCVLFLFICKCVYTIIATNQT